MGGGKDRAVWNTAVNAETDPSTATDIVFIIEKT